MNRSTESRSRRLALVTAAALAVCLLAPMDAEARVRRSWTRTRIESYVMGDVGPLFTHASCGIGVACFGRAVGDQFTVTIVDDSGRRVGGVVELRDGLGTTLTHAFCGSTGAIRVWPGEALWVYLDAPGDVRGANWFDAPGCAEIRPVESVPGATTQGATRGHVRVTFSGH